jgi:hypothetical protein
MQGIGGYWQVFSWCSTTVAAMIVGKHISDSMSLTLSSQVQDMDAFASAACPPTAQVFSAGVLFQRAGRCAIRVPRRLAGLCPLVAPQSFIPSL